MWRNGKAAWTMAPLALCVLAACSGHQTGPSPAIAGAGTIVELEGQFAAAVRARGAKAAFLEFLAEDSIILQPGPVWGRAAWEAADELSGTLAWVPDRAQLAADGRLGFSTGPWTLTDAEGKRTVEGRYVTVWRKTADAWRVVFDGGFARAPTNDTAVASPPRLDEAHCESDPAARAGDLQLLDLGLAGAPDDASYSERMQQHAAPGLVVFHPPNAEGAEGAEALAAALAALSPATHLLPMGAGMAASGDLGYTYGLAAPEAQASAEAAYVHIWCRTTDGWRLLLELRGRLPRPAD